MLTVSGFSISVEFESGLGLGLGLGLGPRTGLGSGLGLGVELLTSIEEVSKGGSFARTNLFLREGLLL